MHKGIETWYNRSKVFQADGLQLDYHDEGEGDTLLCIHGFPTSSIDFESIWDGLISGYRVIAADLIGLGKSSKPLDRKLTVSLQADCIEALLEELKIADVHILAHDLGDTVAQELLARQNEGINRINYSTCVLMNGGIFPETHKPKLIQKLLLSPLGPLIAQLSSKRTFEKNMHSIFSKENPPNQDFLDAAWELLEQGDGKRMLPKLIYYMTERRINRERWVSPLEKQIVPIMLINGVQDPISGQHMTDRFEELIPNSKIVRLKDAGHYPHVETPEQVLKHILDFLASQKQRS